MAEVAREPTSKIDVHHGSTDDHTETVAEKREIITERLLTSARIYFEILGLEDVLKNVDFETLLQSALQKTSHGRDLTDTDIIDPVYKDPRFRPVLCELVYLLTERAEQTFKDGELLTSLKFITLAGECARISGVSYPHKLWEYYRGLSIRIVPGGQLETLFRKVKRILPGKITGTLPPTALTGPEPTPLLRAPQDVLAAPPASPARPPMRAAEKPPRQNWPGDYRHSEIKKLAEYPIGVLIRYATQAREYLDWKSVEFFQREVVKREPAYVKAWICLAIALERLEKFQEAIEVRLEIEKRDPNVINQEIIESLRREINKRKPARPPEAPTAVTLPAAVKAEPPSVPPGPPVPPPEAPSPPPPPTPSLLPPSPPPLRLVPSPPPEAPKPLNLNRSRFDHYIESLLREAQGFEQDFEKPGNAWRKIPEHHLEILRKDFNDFDRSLTSVINREDHPKFYNFFDKMVEYLESGVINMGIVEKIQKYMTEEIWP